MKAEKMLNVYNFVIALEIQVYIIFVHSLAMFLHLIIVSTLFSRLFVSFVEYVNSLNRVIAH